jgi:hypothetical protein
VEVGGAAISILGHDVNAKKKKAGSRIQFPLCAGSGLCSNVRCSRMCGAKRLAKTWTEREDEA